MVQGNENPASPKARAARLKEARDVAGLTLKETASSGMINFNTLCGWEIGKHGGLTERGALLVIKRLEEFNTECSLEWLLYGEGESPKKRTSISAEQNETANKWTTSLHKLILQANPDLLCLQITDASMAPEYNIGDHVYGSPFALDIHQLSPISGKTVLVQEQSGNLILRKLLVNQITNEALLIASNHSFHPSFLYNPNIQAIAIVVCHIKNHGLIIK